MFDNAGFANRGVGVPPPTPWRRSAKFTKLAKSRLFSKNFYVNLIQNDLNDTWNFFDVGLSVDPLDPPPKFTPSGPPWSPVHWRSLLIMRCLINTRGYNYIKP